MNARQKAQQIVDSVRGPVGLTRQQYEEYFVDRITEALQEAAKVEWPSAGEVDVAAVEYARGSPQAYHEAKAFQHGIGWLLARVSKKW